MNQEHDGANQTAEQWAAFQQIWGETFSKLMQLGFTYSPETAPPDFMRQMRRHALLRAFCVTPRLRAACPNDKSLQLSN